MKKTIYLLLFLFCLVNVYAQNTDRLKNIGSKKFEKTIENKMNTLKENANKGIENLKAYIKNEKEWNRTILGYEVETPISEETKRVKEEEIETLLTVPAYVDNQSKLEDDITLIKIDIEQKIEAKETVPKNETENVKKSSNSENNTTLEVNKDRLFEDEKLLIPSISPITDKYYISSEFGRRFHPLLFRYKFHNGIDLAAPKDTKVYATATGTIIKSGSNGNYGNYILIQHKNGFETAYAHLSTIKVENGAMVKQGQVIGAVGSTGISTGNHLHYEIIKNKKRINPKSYL